MFRFKLAPQGNHPGRPGGGRPGSVPPGSGVSPGKIMGGAGLLALGLAVFAGWMLGRGGVQRNAIEVEGEPVIVAMQKIGQLHTATFTLHDVMRASTEGQTDNPIASLPIASSLYHWGTHNEALMTVEGTVEAGINLARLTENDVTKIKAPDGSTHLRVHLPPVVIYRPNVRLSVENSRTGPFWRDENLIPKAQAEAEQMFRTKAEQGNIREHAEAGAVEQLQKMQSALGHSNIEFYF